MTATANQSIAIPNPPIKQAKLYINGQWRSASDGKTRPTISPITEAAIADIPQASAQDVEDAILAARRAFDDGPWAKMTGHERQQILTRASQIMEQYADDLALCETLDMGKAIHFAKTIDARLIADLFRYYAGMAPEIDGATRPVSPPPDCTLKHVTIVREPLGVVAAITPFNFPLLLAGTKIAAALAAGNTVIHKPASATPLSAIKLAEIFAEAGLPAGVYNMITGSGSQVGDQLVKHPAINKISFTGSTEVGIGIIRNSADTLKKTTMELGGKSANIVFADADLESAIANAFFGIFYNKGEICTAGSRLLLERSIHDVVVDGLIKYVSQIKMGNPLDPDVLFGPLADAGQLKKVMQYVEYGKQDGATLKYGGERFYPDGSNGKGYYFQPTIFTNATNEMRIAQEEIFGPVLTVIPFDTEEEAIRIANSTTYGLAAAVHTRDIKKALRVANAMQAGTCWINCYNVYDVSVPFGGYKSSGFGRECGKEVMENYTHTKSIWIDLS
ncbi:Betaine-aldehyde dehydrogenase [Gloeocapsa sp. PCC 7428]|uniref:aldehyde dehydrogenase family protein n=1 Tax=Gloeocapsa sp. PCC 7428 TaxID=1173026 RepID=UPI0002A5CE0A|nr:aldehyde dehydrogenase family protein [Gloeocapsa sp. PCC 7428]AFZ30373.1 Betaine-aldehyde dehydrogenase [Gloeocapsa sp. PCC 7428]